MDIRREMKRISDSHGLQIQGKTFQEKVMDALTDSLSELFAHHTVAIKGGGEHTKELLKLIRAAGYEDSVYGIFDRKYTEPTQITIGEKEFRGLPDEKMRDCEADVVIASSFAHRREVAGEIKRTNDNLKVFDVYDELEKKGLILNFLFYRINEEGYESLLYYRSVYMKNKDRESLWNYLVACLAICDFIHFRRNAETYIQNGWDESDRLKDALQEFEELFTNIRAVLKKRRQRDVLMLWVDQLERRELPLCPFIEREAESSMFLENAYTVTPFTAATFHTIFQNKKSLDDRYYVTEHEIWTAENSNLLRVIEKNGYDFTYIGDAVDANLFREEDKISNYTWGTSTIRCMELLQKLMDSEKPAFILLHELVETHSPYLSGELDNARMIAWPYFLGVSERERVEQIRRSALFWDEQWEWYDSFLGDSIVKIYMSDHGKRYNIQPIYKEPTTHVITFVKGPGVPVKRIKKLFSLLHFDKLVEAVLTETYDEELFCSDYVELQETAIFNDTTIKFYVENHAENSAKAFRAIRTATELYAKLITGEQFYYLLPDEETDRSKDPEFAERIQELSKLAGDYFWSFDGYEDKLKFFRKRLEGHE